MAYREFRQEKTYEEPDYSPIYHGITNLFQALNTNKLQREKSADQFKFDIGNRKFANDDALIKTQAFNAINMIKHDYLNQGRPTPQSELALQGAKEAAAQSDIQFQQTEDIVKRIDKKDEFFDKQNAEKILKKATHGEDNEVNYLTRQDRLNEADKAIDSDPTLFKIPEYTAHYINLFKEKEKIRSTGNPNVKATTSSSGVFVNPVTGKPEVTDQHSIDFLKSRPEVQKYIEHDVDGQLDNEIKQMKANGEDSRTSWMKGLSNAEIKSELINDPSKNLINKQDFGERVRDEGKNWLSKMAKTTEKVDIEYKKDLSKTGGLYNNDAIAHGYTFHNEEVGTEGTPDDVAGAFRMSKNAAPGGYLMISKGANVGKPITFDASSSNVFNVNSGTTTKARGSAQFNLTGYQIQAYDKAGKPYIIEATNPKELLNKIKTIPVEDFKSLEPQMSVALKGYSLDRAKMLGDTRTKMYDLNQQLAQAKSDNDLEKIANITNRLDELKEFKQELNTEGDDYTQDDILNAAAKNGITSIRSDQLIKADKSDVDRVNGITEGLNLWNESKWSPEMKEVADAYKKRAQEAASAGYKSTSNPALDFNKAIEQKPKSKVKKSQVPTVASDEDYNKLPSGAEYVGPDGVKRKKK